MAHNIVSEMSECLGFLFEGVLHTLEVYIVFGIPYMDDNPDVKNDSRIYLTANEYNDFDREYSDFMMSMWRNFARER